MNNVSPRKVVEQTQRVTALIAKKFKMNDMNFFRELEDMLTDPENVTPFKLVERAIIPALTTMFDPIERFKNNKIVHYYFHEEFTKYLLDEVKPFKNIPEVAVDKLRLIYPVSDSRLSFEIGATGRKRLLSEKEILYRISYLVEQQANDKGGLLFKKEQDLQIYIGTCVCSDGIARAARIMWYESENIEHWDCAFYDQNSFEEDDEIICDSYR
jgi:hypothetical protein